MMSRWSTSPVCPSKHLLSHSHSLIPSISVSRTRTLTVPVTLSCLVVDSVDTVRVTTPLLRVSRRAAVYKGGRLVGFLVWLFYLAVLGISVVAPAMPMFDLRPIGHPHRTSAVSFCHAVLLSLSFSLSLSPSLHFSLPSSIAASLGSSTTPLCTAALLTP